jgi:uncharacterized protein YcfL
MTRIIFTSKHANTAVVAKVQLVGCQSRTGQAKTDFEQVVAERAASGGKRLSI